VGNHDLKSMAEELERLLKASPRKHEPPHIDESFFAAAEPTPSPEQLAIDEHKELLPELVRSIVEYAITRAPATASASTIGEAIGEGVGAAVDQLSLSDKSVAEAVNAFLNELCVSVRDTLTLE
jgi:hypothetical protein